MFLTDINIYIYIFIFNKSFIFNNTILLALLVIYKIVNHLLFLEYVFMKMKYPQWTGLHIFVGHL